MLQQLGPYRLVRPLGAGGMGTVYLAEDTRVGRRVALKLLPEAVAADPSRLARFRRESQILARLQHPGIVTLHSVEEADGATFFTMEHVDGTPLSRLLGPRGLPLDRFYAIAIEVAEALAAAHERGIVHRDLKPDNVIAAHGGHVKVLDFGIARFTSREPRGDSTQDTTEAGLTEESQPLTAVGRVVGTVAYMSPEQAEGKPCDARSDIFSLGVMLHEMLAGERPFRGDSWSSTLAAILRDRPPPLAGLRPGVPPGLTRIVERCLAKDPRQRYQAALDLAHDLRAARDGIALVEPANRRRLFALGAGLTAVALLAFAVWRTLQPTHPIVVNMQALTNAPGLELYPAISPDGQSLAYASGQPLRIRVRRLAGGRSVVLTEETSLDQRSPVWSPDGESIAFRAGELWVVPALGGQAKLVETLTESVAFSPDGSELAFIRDDTIYARPTAGGASRRIATVPSGSHALDWSPDGSWIAFAGGNQAYVGASAGNVQPAAILLVPAAGGEPVAVTDHASVHASPVWSGNTGLYFVSNRGGDFDVYYRRIGRSGRPTGSIERITTGRHVHTVSVSGDGTRMVISELPLGANLWSIRVPPPEDWPISIGEAQPFTSGQQSIESVAVSRDGKWLAYDSNLHGSQDIYKVPIAGGEPERLTADPEDDFFPTWSGDGRWLAYYSIHGGQRRLKLVSAEGGPIREVLDGDWEATCPDWSPVRWEIAHGGGSRSLGTSGLFVAASSDDGATWRAPQRVPISDASCARWSPDGSVLALTGQERVRLVAGGVERGLPVPALRYNNDLVWSRDARLLYAKSLDSRLGGIVAVPLDGSPPRLAVKFDDPRRTPSRVSFASDGDRFYFIVRDTEGDLWDLELEMRR